MADLLKKQHPRDKRVKKAQEEVSAAIAEIFNRYELSYGEVFHILSEYMSICAEVMMDKERTGMETREMCRLCGEAKEKCQCRDGH